MLDSKATKGDKYTVVAIINNTVQKVTVDSGSFLSLISLKKSKELGLKINRVHDIPAKAATGSLILNHSALVTLDFGVVKVNTVMAVCDHSEYNEDLILLGSNGFSFEKSLLALK